MRKNGKLDYIELPATGGKLDHVKAFYSAAFAWSFTDYGPTYAAFDEGLDGGFQADVTEAPAKPLPILYSSDLEATLAAVESAGGTMARPIFAFPGGRRFHFVDPPATSWRSGASDLSGRALASQPISSAGETPQPPASAMLSPRRHSC